MDATFARALPADCVTWGGIGALRPTSGAEAATRHPGGTTEAHGGTEARRFVFTRGGPRDCPKNSPCLRASVVFSARGQDRAAPRAPACRSRRVRHEGLPRRQ